MATTIKFIEDLAGLLKKYNADALLIFRSEKLQLAIDGTYGANIPELDNLLTSFGFAQSNTCVGPRGMQRQFIAAAASKLQQLRGTFPTAAGDVELTYDHTGTGEWIFH